FFFQAEDGIRDFHVTGVQTCALPISAKPAVRYVGSAVFASSETPCHGVHATSLGRSKKGIEIKRFYHRQCVTPHSLRRRYIQSGIGQRDKPQEPTQRSGKITAEISNLSGRCLCGRRVKNRGKIGLKRKENDATIKKGRH